MCSQSLTFPARPPGPEDERDRRRDLLAASGEKRRTLTPVEDQDQVVTQHQDQEVLPERQDTNTQASPSAQLMCHCCREMLPPSDFYANNYPKARNRLFRSWRCRGCTSFRLRVTRQLDPEGTRRRGREQRARHSAGMTPGQREAEKQRREKTRESTNAASRRYQARRRGAPVPLQRQGRLPVFIKPICRISEGCPLRRFCTIENKGLA